MPGELRLNERYALTSPSRRCGSKPIYSDPCTFTSSSSSHKIFKQNNITFRLFFLHSSSTPHPFCSSTQKYLKKSEIHFKNMPRYVFGMKVPGGASSHPHPRPSCASNDIPAALGDGHSSEEVNSANFPPSCTLERNTEPAHAHAHNSCSSNNGRSPSLGAGSSLTDDRTRETPPTAAASGVGVGAVDGIVGLPHVHHLAKPAVPDALRVPFHHIQRERCDMPPSPI